ncbi:hypothetical protein [Novosphingobium sp.]|uniref:hypothetical protein n=1 Tax=Novosphingobium sp. TaxID=1874826 RepID=UPI00262CE5D1|nr:hypothetical protein [Novosphingobium sp.]
MASAAALALAPVAVQAEQVCPDAATVQAARIVEFQTMMMGVAVRCRHVGVPIMDHLDGMNSARRTMFVGSNDRVATFLRSLNAKPSATTAALAAPTPASPAKAAPAKAAPAKAALGKAAPGKAGPGKAGPGKAGLKKTANAEATPAITTPAASPAPGKARKGPASAASRPATGPAKPPTAKISRRTDPYDRYLTMIGNQYGAGITTLQRCKAFDAIVMSLSDKTNTDRLLTMVSSSLVQATLLEAIVNCPAGK